jgi:spoIIIJ-associated protein
MNASERRVIHMALQDDESITTDSEGEEPYRKVVIRPK